MNCVVAAAEKEKKNQKKGEAVWQLRTVAPGHKYTFMLVRKQRCKYIRAHIHERLQPVCLSSTYSKLHKAFIFHFGSIYFLFYMDFFFSRNMPNESMDNTFMVRFCAMHRHTGTHSFRIILVTVWFGLLCVGSSYNLQIWRILVDFYHTDNFQLCINIYSIV